MIKDLEKILNNYWGHQSFRGSQQSIIENVISKTDTLALLPTGGGKSICYQIPALATQGICIVISPLIALMIDQVNNLKNRKINAECIHSGLNLKDIDRILDNCIFGNIKLLYISPERINSKIFIERFKKMNVSFIAVDEAHCISQWGYDFRPSYLKIANLKEISPNLSCVALTATATPKVCLDIQEKLLFKKKNTIKDSFQRKNLSYKVIKTKDKYSFTINLLKNKRNQSSIVYVRKRKMCTIIYKLLIEENIKCDYYHAGLNNEEKISAQQNWSSGKSTVMIATSAFGMGIDKEDVRLVINFDIPESIEAYFQEAGRAGRDNKSADAYLLTQNSDKATLINRVNLSYPKMHTIKTAYQKFCNIHQIALGSGENESFDFNYNLIASKTDLTNLEVFHCFRLLELSGYINLSSSSYHSSKLKIICSKKTLFNFIKTNPTFSLLLETLIRSYSGLFNDFSSINEIVLSKRIHQAPKETITALTQLDQLNIISYSQNTSSLKLTLSHPRVDAQSIVIDPTIYTARKEADLERANNVIQYSFNTTTCRVRFLLNYFGEKKSTNCNNCDNCIKNNNTNKKSFLLEKIETIISSPIEVDTVYESLIQDFHKKDIDNVLRKMIEHGKVKINSLNQLELKN